jgi:predicted CoA-substrate-specific enzyme activase
MITAGIDVGSLTAKCVIMDTDILAYKVIKVSPNLNETAERVFDETLRLAGLTEEDIDAIVATGYGRNNVDFASKQITEISCHARGAIFVMPTARTVIDIGGQDSKAIALNERGGVADFVMNDKCAAGTGRFLEVMANALGVKLEKLGELSLKAKRKVKISSTCTVFAESEVISHIANNISAEEIIAGIHEAIASRIVSLAHRIPIKKDIVLTGGVAKNIGVKKALEDRLGMEIKTPEEPQIIGAIGAAIFGKKVES